MKKSITIGSSLLFLMISFSSFSAAIRAKVSGDWSSASSWDLNRIPQCGDQILIPKGIVVTISDMVNLNAGENCERTRLSVAGTLQFTGGKKMRFSNGTIISLLSGGLINPSKTGGGTSEAIEIGTMTWWKSANGPLKGKEDIKGFFAAQEEDELQKQVLKDARSGGTIVGKKGIKIIVKPGSLTNAQGALIEGPVDVEFMEFFKRTDMLFSNKPTMGVQADGNLSPLVSGGEYYLRISQNGQDVIAKEGVEVQLKVLYPASDMELFDGKIDAAGELSWLPLRTKAEVINAEFDGKSVPAYSVNDLSWGWTNIDKFVNDPRPKTRILVKLPTGYNSSNTRVFVTFDGIPNLLADLDEYTPDGYFTEHYGYLPIGMMIHVIALSKNGEQLMSVSKAVTVSDHMTIETGALNVTSKENLESYLNALP